MEEIDKKKFLHWLKNMLEFEKQLSEENEIHKKIANRYAYIIQKINMGVFDK